MARLDGQHHNYVIKVLPCPSIPCLSIPDGERERERRGGGEGIISKPEGHSTMMDETRHQLATVGIQLGGDG